MAVYREGFLILSVFEVLESPVFIDAVDQGVPVFKNKKTWNHMLQLKEMYGEAGTEEKNKDLGSCSFEFTLIDEWAVSDERKTLQQATERYKLTYYSLKHFHPNVRHMSYKKADGFLTIERLKS